MEPRTCDKCGLVHERCAGHKRNGEPCRQHPMDYQDVCWMHGGKSPQALAAAARRRQEAEARQAVQIYGGPLDVNPVEALLDEVKWTAGHVAWLRERVREVEQKNLTMGVTQQVVTSGGDVPGSKAVTVKAAPNIWIELYQREREHLVRVCAAALRAGIEERQVRLAERYGDKLADLIEAILGDLQLTEAQQERVPEVVLGHFKAFAGGKAA